MSVMVVLAISAWIFNVIYIDNAVPPVLDSITAIFTHPIADYTSTAIFWLTLLDYAPLLFLFCGVVGLILECTIWGVSTQDQP
jgi:hypothetical protein